MTVRLLLPLLALAAAPALGAPVVTAGQVRQRPPLI